MRCPILMACMGLFVAPVQAQEGPAAPIFFRRPDLETAREIERLLKHNGLGSGTRTERTKARRELRNIGVWTVPYLTGAIVGRKHVKGVRVPMNAILALGRILDPHCLPALRTVAETDRGRKQVEVRKTACLVLGLFRDPDGKSVDTLVQIIEERKSRQPYHRAAALALGRIDHKDAAAVLVAQTRPSLPAKADPHYASAVLLAASIRSNSTEPERFLRHKEELVRRTAATCLMIRPLGARQHSYLTDLLDRRAKDRKVRPLLYHALARIARTPEIRARLLKCATRTDEREEARVAALIGLAGEWNVQSNYMALKRAMPRGRNDPVASAMLFALAQCGHEDAIDDLMQTMRGGSSHSRFYAAGSLLYVVTLSNPKRKHPQQDRIFDRIAELRDPRLKDFVTAVGALKYEMDLEKRAARARDWFRGIRDPYGLHLWDWTPTDRAWALVNRLIPAIFDLDDIADPSDFDNPNKTGGTPLGAKPDTGARKLPATPEEQDLLEFLAEQPYFGPEDLGER